MQIQDEKSKGIRADKFFSFFSDDSKYAFVFQISEMLALSPAFISRSAPPMCSGVLSLEILAYGVSVFFCRRGVRRCFVCSG